MRFSNQCKKGNQSLDHEYLSDPLNPQAAIFMVWGHGECLQRPFHNLGLCEKNAVRALAPAIAMRRGP